MMVSWTPFLACLRPLEALDAISMDQESGASVIELCRRAAGVAGGSVRPE